MSVRMTAAFATIVLLAMGAIDYQMAASAQPGGPPLSISTHVMDRVTQARVAMGLAAPSAASALRVSSAPPPPPDTPFGKALAVVKATLTGDTDTIFVSAGPVASLPEAATSGDSGAKAAAAQDEFGKVAAALEEAEPAPRRGSKGKPGVIKVGIGTCTKGGAGKFCSVEAKPKK